MQLLLLALKKIDKMRTASICQVSKTKSLEIWGSKDNNHKQQSAISAKFSEQTVTASSISGEEMIQKHNQSKPSRILIWTMRKTKSTTSATRRRGDLTGAVLQSASSALNMASFIMASRIMFRYSLFLSL